MIELLMFIIIVGIAVAGVLSILNITTRSSADPQLRKQALAIAEGLLEEVQLARFTYCDPSDATAEKATGAFITGAAGTVGVGCTATVEAVGPPAGAMRPYNNVNDYVTAFGVAQRAFDLAGVLSDAAGNPIAATGNYVATLTITSEALNGIASTDAPATMNVLRISVNVSYNGGRDVITLEGYRARYAPNAIP
jgi:MSHA pilin protein MshD